MATTTTNYGLTKPGYSDTADVADINENMDKIDGVLNYVSDSIGIVVDGDKTAYADGVEIGQFVILRNSTITGCDDGLYKAAKTIPYNTVIDSTYLTAEPSGAANALNASLTPEIIWQNTSASISAQTIPFDVARYRMIMVRVTYGNSDLAYGGIETLMECSVNEVANVAIPQKTGAAIATRAFKIVSSGLEVLNGGYIVGSSYTQENSYAVPNRILGFK